MSTRPYGLHSRSSVPRRLPNDYDGRNSWENEQCLFLCVLPGPPGWGAGGKEEDGQAIFEAGGVHLAGFSPRCDHDAMCLTLRPAVPIVRRGVVVDGEAEDRRMERSGGLGAAGGKIG